MVRARDASDAQVKRLQGVASKVQERLTSTIKTASKAESEESKSSKTKITILQRSNADVTSKWQKEKHAREEQVIQIENLQREIRRIQQQMTKAVRDREVMSKKVRSGEEQKTRVCARSERRGFARGAKQRPDKDARNWK